MKNISAEPKTASEPGEPRGIESEWSELVALKKKHPEHVNLERWLVSYADFITLLFAFFVVMYAISQADIAKFNKVATSIKAAFSSAGPVGQIDLEGAAGGDSVNMFEPAESRGGRPMDMPAGKIHTAADPDPQLQDLKEMLEESISLDVGASDASAPLRMEYDSRGLIIRMAVRDLFDPGSTRVSQDLQPLLDKIGRVLARSNRLIRIEGHTDASEVEIAKQKGFASDWELSSARAAFVAQYWLTRFDFTPRRLGVAGYSHYRPLTKGNTDVERASNRRIEIIVLNNQYEK